MNSSEITELQKAEVLIEALPYIQRFNRKIIVGKYGGSGIMKRLKAQAEERGLHWIDWNVCAEDATASHPDAAQILRNIRRDADGQDTCVVLLHDTKATGQTVKALPDMIAYFREQGYTFCTVAQMDALQCETK